MALKEMAAKDEAAEIDEHLGRLGNLGRFKAVQTTLTTVKDTVQKSGRLRKVWVYLFYKYKYMLVPTPGTRVLPVVQLVKDANNK